MADASIKLASLPFQEQIAFFRRKLNLSTNAWTDIWQEQHDHAFVVAGANRDDLVADFRDAVDKAISQGGTLASFRKDFDQIVEKYGWSYNGGRNWRSRVIYETNLRTSYAAGRYEQLQAVKALRPFWRYRHSDSVLHPRPMHLAWNGLILHADDPWWQTHFAPNGWGCECTIESLSQRDLIRLGKHGPDTAPADDMQEVTVGSKGPSPRVVETPAGVDPGFGYTPGASAFGNQVVDTLAKSARFPADAAARSAAEVLSNTTATRALDAQYGQWLKQAAMPASSELSTIAGALSPKVVTALAEAGIEPATAAVTMQGSVVTHTLDNADRTGLPKAALRVLPQALRQPLAVLLDARQRLLVYVADVANGRRAAIHVGYELQGTQATDLTNAVRTIGALDEAALQSSRESGDLVLIDGAL
ncbi:phage minor head protein [Dyella terrae]|uniref:phage head morphogenesis protein n=1 Tax=Dyella terrae TaxID=522259 RepID=UPI001EFC3397|nr:phage minor head protein [Dyella terrae]ULU26602.1 phage protein F [Dyella terrae]